MAVQVADQEDGLEEEQGRCPGRRRAAKDRQDQSSDQRLHAEQQERGQPDRKGER